jgi:hypothetical protein
MNRRVHSRQADRDWITTRIYTTDDLARFENASRRMIVICLHRLSQFGNDGLVEAHGHKVVDGSVAVHDTDANEAGLRQRTRGRTDVMKQCRRIALGHQPLRLFEQQRHPTFFELHGCSDDIPSLSAPFPLNHSFAVCAQPRAGVTMQRPI